MSQKLLLQLLLIGLKNQNKHYFTDKKQRKEVTVKLTCDTFIYLIYYL